MDAAGTGYIGVPGLLFGRNRNPALGITNNIGSQQDPYRERTDPGHPDRFPHGDEWVPARSLTERIEARSAIPVDLSSWKSSCRPASFTATWPRRISPAAMVDSSEIATTLPIATRNLRISLPQIRRPVQRAFGMRIMDSGSWTVVPGSSWSRAPKSRLPRCSLRSASQLAPLDIPQARAGRKKRSLARPAGELRSSVPKLQILPRFRPQFRPCPKGSARPAGGCSGPHRTGS